jgi:predicted tellurium resistance membrane protein TerC
MSDPQAWTAIATLTALELVLGIDNIVLLAVVTGKLPEERRALARRIGLALAMLLRILLLLGLSWVLSLTAPLFTVLGHPISGRDLILIGGGLFLLAKGVHEIHDKVEGQAESVSATARTTMAAALVQIVALDVVFSIDSVITAIGMAEHTAVMVIAVVTSVLLMLVVAGPIGAFVERHPTVKMLALSFLLLIGVALVADGLGHHIPRGYIYFALMFSVLVEALNLRTHRRAHG